MNRFFMRDFSSLSPAVGSPTFSALPDDASISISAEPLPSPFFRFFFSITCSLGGKGLGTVLVPAFEASTSASFLARRASFRARFAAFSVGDVTLAGASASRGTNVVVDSASEKCSLPHTCRVSKLKSYIEGLAFHRDGTRRDRSGFCCLAWHDSTAELGAHFLAKVIGHR